MKKNLLVGFLLIFSIVCFSTPAMASFSYVVSFGDSLTDNGTASDPYGFGIYTDALPWADLLAAKHGAGILNVAFGGATTGYGNIYEAPLVAPSTGASVPSFFSGLQWQVGNVLISGLGLDMDSTLFTVWAGANDYNRVMALNARYSRLPSDLELTDAANFAAANVFTALQKIANGGALHILVPDLGIMGNTIFANTYNATLADLLIDFQAMFSDITLYNLDTAAVMAELLFKAGNGELTPEEVAHLSWIDGYHPGSTTHEAIAEAAYLATVPVPGAFLLMASGLIALAGISRRKAA